MHSQNLAIIDSAVKSIQHCTVLSSSYGATIYYPTILGIFCKSLWLCIEDYNMIDILSSPRLPINLQVLFTTADTANFTKGVHNLVYKTVMIELPASQHRISTWSYA